MELKGCDSNFEVPVNIFQILKVATNKYLPCLKQYVLGKRFKTIITMTKN